MPRTDLIEFVCKMLIILSLSAQVSKKKGRIESIDRSQVTEVNQLIVNFINMLLKN